MRVPRKGLFDRHTKRMIPDLPFLQPKRTWNRVIGTGEFARVHDLGDGLVAKVYHTFPATKKCPQAFAGYEHHLLQSEHHALEQLYAAGLNVPKPEGVYLIPLRWAGSPFSPEPQPGLVMERIQGKDVRKFIHKNQHVRSLLASELRKAHRLGIHPHLPDVNGNGLYDKKQDRLWIVDVVFWDL